MEPIRLGDTVALKRDCKAVGGPPERDNRTAVVTRVLEDIEGGLFMADGLRGCRYWNIEDVRLATQPRPSA